MKFNPAFAILFVFPFVLNAQLDITDNMVVNSGDSIHLSGGIFEFSDFEEDGVIHIKNVHDIYIDGSSTELNGDGFQGYGIKIEGSTNVTIANFQNISGYFYAVHAVNSPGLVIENCTINSNKRDDEGWIVIFEGPEGAHGGAIYMEECNVGRVENCSMTDQNDAVALYSCDSITVHNNTMAWNTSFGIRMYHTHNSTITDNIASHINRPLEDPTDCASILLLDAFNNVVTGNDFTYSGDGIFLNNYNTMEPANNYFAYNDCSYSPHNAIEAVFSDGNVFKHNICNNSNYGFWLGYSFNSVIDSNEIKFNAGLDADGGGAIAIDRGYNNTITNNEIAHNSNGIKLWKGGGIAPYTSSNSRDYFISKNYFKGNRRAITINNTTDVVIDNCDFLKNKYDITILGENDFTDIGPCTFANTISKIIDHHGADPPSLGITIPDYSEVDIDFDCKFKNIFNFEALTLFDQDYILHNGEDLAENNGDNDWTDYFFVEDATPIEISWDNNDKYAGENSVKCVAPGAGFDVHLHHFAGGDDLTRSAIWDLDPNGNIHFAMKINITDANNIWGVQESFVRIGDACGNYLQYNNEYFTSNNNPVLNASLDTWATYEIPLVGNDTWKLTTKGFPDLTAITYIEFNVDVWEWGYELWLDDVRLPVRTSASDEQEIRPLTISPNPTNSILQIDGEVQLSGQKWNIFSENGKILKSGKFGKKDTIDVSDLSEGLYYLSLPLISKNQTHKFIIVN